MAVMGQDSWLLKDQNYKVQTTWYIFIFRLWLAKPNMSVYVKIQGWECLVYLKPSQPGAVLGHGSRPPAWQQSWPSQLFTAAEAPDLEDDLVTLPSPPARMCSMFGCSQNGVGSGATSIIGCKSQYSILLAILLHILGGCVKQKFNKIQRNVLRIIIRPGWAADGHCASKPYHPSVQPINAHFHHN